MHASIYTNIVYLYMKDSDMLMDGWMDMCMQTYIHTYKNIYQHILMFSYFIWTILAHTNIHMYEYHTYVVTRL